MISNNITRSRSFVIIAAHYVVATLIGWLAYRSAMYCLADSMWALFVADAIATIYIWVLGLVYRNVSFYDPYWSVAPPVMLTAWAAHCGHPTAATLILLAALWFWALRLTYNWAVTFRGMAHEDWRYAKFRTQCHPLVFHLINFFGLNMVPTVVVFLAMIPAFHTIGAQAPATPLTIVGGIATAGAVVLQMVSDSQSHHFRAQHPGQVCNVGLWRHGRHPNYLGEILVWWGVWIIELSHTGWAAQGWHIAGPLAVTLLFCTVSIPLMEQRQLATKPQYAEYRRHTRLFI